MIDFGFATNFSKNEKFSVKVGSINYLRVFTITLQADKTLKLHSYESENTALLDTFAYKCEFLGTKVTP